jgi:hypothetical protein
MKGWLIINDKVHGRKRPWPNLRYSSSISLQGWGKPRKPQCRLFAGCDSYKKFPEYEARFLTTRPRRSVDFCREEITFQRHTQLVSDSEIFTLNSKEKLIHYTSRRRLGGEEVSSYSFLTSALDGSEWLVWEKMDGEVWEERKVYKVLVGKPEGKRPLRRPRRRWEDGIRMDLRDIGWGVDWIWLTQYRDRWRAIVNGVMNVRVLAPRSYLVGWLVS